MQEKYTKNPSARKKYIKRAKNTSSVQKNTKNQAHKKYTKN